jgi:hypothetical protein
MEETGYPVIEDIRGHWHWIKPEIENILERSPQFTYLPEDVYAACKSGVAQCFVHAGGFVITQIDIDRFTGDKSLVLWLAGAKQRGNDYSGIFSDFFKQVAQSNGCVKVQTSTAVPEVGEHLQGIGWKLDQIIYTQTLTDTEES